MHPNPGSIMCMIYFTMLTTSLPMDFGLNLTLNPYVISNCNYSFNHTHLNTKNGTVLLFSIHNFPIDHVKHYSTFIEWNACYAMRYGYIYRHYNASSFHIHSSNASLSSLVRKTPHMWRVILSAELLEKENFDFVVYLDLDVVLNFKYSVPISRFVRSIENVMSQRSCDVIFQDIGHVFNSGFYVLKRSEISQRSVNLL